MAACLKQECDLIILHNISHTLINLKGIDYLLLYKS